MLQDHTVNNTGIVNLRKFLLIPKLLCAYYFLFFILEHKFYVPAHGISDDKWCEKYLGTEQVEAYLVCEGDANLSRPARSGRF